MKETEKQENDLNATDEPRSGKRVSRGVLVLIGVLFIAGLVYYFATAQKDPQREAQQEAKRVVAAVAKLMILPEGEDPIIATVADPSKLEDQPFFASAKKGDKVLIYNIARKAVLYSEDENRIVDVAPLSPGKTSPSPAQ